MNFGVPYLLMRVSIARWLVAIAAWLDPPPTPIQKRKRRAKAKAKPREYPYATIVQMVSLDDETGEAVVIPLNDLLA